MEFTEEERDAMIEDARIGNKKYRQQLANYIYTSKNRPKINAYYRRRYAESEEIREKSRIKQNRFRYLQGRYVRKEKQKKATRRRTRRGRRVTTRAMGRRQCRLASHIGKERACDTHAKGGGALDPGR